MNKENLLLVIESKREELHHSALRFGMNSKEVLKCSEELDKLIITYQTLKTS
ncbi:aspartyl-phosphate phosphatase Spo0E family protein [Alkalihalophilus sp. As8PL]|uniref:Aspartyl-phosphate phosphatase Spo0E family protein n=2 Tax=Alkalihalophilus TaxID=2893060 RepID=A0AB39BPY5_9BACI|nr:aspartyl-phosphate phosphatase Spo0E family protein [Alkalihalophilus lindianensis]MDV2684486.1 aspartyl-phosphate phosphatase Spo0E family protein [Alkalihalophilus lindianensis]